MPGRFSTCRCGEREWWKGLLYEVRFYLFLERKPAQLLGHNELAHVAMFFMNTLMTFFMIITGFALYGAGSR